MRDLCTFTNQELVDFFNSFDNIISDIDGVVWNVLETIPGTTEAIKSLKKRGKQIVFVTNNTTRTIDALHQRFIKANFDVDKNNLVNPTLSIISYLEKKRLQNRKIFVIGMSPLKDSLRKAGFTLIETEPKDNPYNLHEFVIESIAEEQNVGVVIVDVDLDLNYVSLQKAVTYLQHPEVLFICGARDIWFPIGTGRELMGPGVFVELLEKTTRREAIPMAKLSPFLNEFIVEKYKMTDRSRILVMGDSIPEDMGVGSKFGYRKLLVLSGLSTRSSLENWRFPEEFKPDFYVESLGKIQELIERAFGDQI